MQGAVIYWFIFERISLSQLVNVRHIGGWLASKKYKN